MKLVSLKNIDEEIGLNNIKDPKYNHSNELLVIKTNNKLNIAAKRLSDFLFYATKQKLIKENIQEVDNYIKLTIPLEDLYLALGNEKGNYVGYKGYLIKSLIELNNTKLLKINLVKTPIEIKDEKRFLEKVKDNELKSYSQNDIIGNFSISDDVVIIYIGEIIANQLLRNNNYTQFNYLINNFLKSIYSINLYHFLIASFQAQMDLMKKGKIEKKDIIQTAFIEIDKFYEIMDVTNIKIAKTFSRFNDLILKKAIKELNENKVVEFEIVEVLKKKNGRKIVKLAFLLKLKKDYYYPLFDKEKYKIFLTRHNDYCNLDLKNKNKNKKEIVITSNNNDEIEKTTEIESDNLQKNEILNNWNGWRKNLLQNGDIIILLEEKIFKLKNGYLFENEKLLSSEKSFEVWQNLYENREKLQIKTEDEYLQEQIKKAQEQENKYKKLDEIRKKYERTNILAQINKNTPILEYYIETIQFGKDNKIELYMEESKTKERSLNLFPNIDVLEEFLKISRNNYLKNKDDKNSKIKINENEKLLSKVEKLKNKYINAKLLIEIDENNSFEAEVVNIEVDKSIELYLNIEGGGKIIESFGLTDDEVNRLEKFLKICNEAYLKTQKDDLKSKLSSFIKKF